MKTISWQSLSSSKLLRVLFTIVMVAFWTACADDSQNIKGPDVDAASGKAKISQPIVTVTGTTRYSINFEVCAGSTGLPAGFSVQWMTKSAYDANGGAWLSSDDLSLCKASFSGNASISRYNLKAGECTPISVGEMLFDNGASSNCVGALECGTEYVFRFFGHATSTLNRSDFTSTITKTTDACEEDCTYTQGFWKTHGAAGPASEKIFDEFGKLIGYTSVWPVNTLTLGTVSYTESQLQLIFNTPAGGNGLIALAHQLIAAKLNVAGGATSVDAIAAADLLIGGLVVPNVGSGFLAPKDTGALVTALALYNEGKAGVSHCE